MRETADRAEQELTTDQLARQDAVDNAVHGLLEELAGKDLEWDISLIGEVRQAISEEFAERGIMTDLEFYPYLEL